MKAILVIETDAEHIEDLYVEHIWNDCYPVDLGKEVHFKPMPNRWIPQLNGLSIGQQIRNIDFGAGWNACLEKIRGEE